MIVRTTVSDPPSIHMVRSTFSNNIFNMDCADHNDPAVVKSYNRTNSVVPNGINLSNCILFSVVMGTKPSMENYMCK